MNELNRIIKLFSDLQDGDCWIGNNFKQVLSSINSVDASKKINDKDNSIWQLVNHLIYWRNIVINRLNGNMDHPPFEDFNLLNELTEANWKQTLADFENTYHLLRNRLADFKIDLLNQPSPKPSQTYYQLMIGCLQHDAYHLGQIVLTKKLISGDI